MRRFINRKEELNILENEYKKKSASFFIIYGRRRVGKTELVLKFLEGKNGIYYLSQKFDIVRQVEDFLEKACSQLGVYVPKLTKWSDALKFVSENIKPKSVIIIDEFSYLIEGDNASLSSFQAAWDLYLKDMNVMIILLGSSVSMMETEVLGYKSPLYGRRTGQMKIHPMEFKNICSFFPKKHIDELMKIYACLGGVPAYLNKFDAAKPFIENINMNILQRATFLYDEASFLLKEELRKPTKYELILEVISKGKNRISEIADNTNIPVQNIPKYLRILINLGFVSKEWPIILKRNKEIKTNSIYFISDIFFRFWYAYIYSLRSELEVNRKFIISKISDTYDIYMGKSFEEISKQFLLELNKSGKLPFAFERIGRQWGKFRGEKGKNTYEIDLCAINERTKQILFCECKWKEKVNAEKVLSDLKEKAEYVPYEGKKWFAIFAKSFKEKIKEPNLLLFDLKDMEKIMK